MAGLQSILRAPLTLIRVGSVAHRLRGVVNNGLMLAWTMLKSRPVLCSARLRNGQIFRFRNNRGDTFLFHEIFANTTYRDALPRKADSLGTVVDLGANIGGFVLFIAGNFDRLVAVEPAPSNCEILHANVEANSLQSKVVIVEAAIAEQCGQGTLYIDDQEPVLNSLTCSNNGSRALRPVPVKLLTLKSLFDEHNIDRCGLLKMDVEGAEYDIVLNTPSSVFNKVASLVIEVHRHGRADYTPLAIEAHLKAEGYQVRWCHVREERDVQIGHGIGLLCAERSVCSDRVDVL